MNDKNFNMKEHFRVPEGYFENLTSQIMANIPEEKQELHKTEAKSITVSRNRFRIPFYAASIAASLLIVVVSVATYTHQQDDKHLAEADIKASTEQYVYTVDEAADYAMLDGQDIYEMITE